MRVGCDGDRGATVRGEYPSFRSTFEEVNVGLKRERSILTPPPPRPTVYDDTSFTVRCRFVAKHDVAT